MKALHLPGWKTYSSLHTPPALAVQAYCNEKSCTDRPCQCLFFSQFISTILPILPICQVLKAAFLRLFIAARLVSFSSTFHMD